EYYVQIDASAFDDEVGNSYAGISDNGWSFTVFAGAVWYDEPWAYRVTVTVDADKVNGDLTNFPVYVDLSDMPESFFDYVNVNGDDIRVTDDTGNTLVASELV